MARVRVLRVLSEDPWKAETVQDIEVDDMAVFTVFDSIMHEYEDVRGYDCRDYGSASIQLCTKDLGDRIEKIMIGLWLEQMPEVIK